jgi:nucleotide-binding universal stress UspA family protein
LRRPFAAPRIIAEGIMVDKPILVAVDFEDASRRPLETARVIGAGVGAPIALVHVYRLPIYTYPGIEPIPVPPPIVYAPEIEAAARKALSELAASYGISPELTFVREGDPADEILEVARVTDAWMIAMGTHGRRGLAHVLLGSVAEQVLRRSPAPVLTVRVAP